MVSWFSRFKCSLFSVCFLDVLNITFSIFQAANNTIYEPNTAHDESTNSLPEMSPILPPVTEENNAILQVYFLLSSWLIYVR